MSYQYQNLARRFRPQTFDEVLGQKSIVTTLQNAIAHQRIAPAYLFCGGRGSGKTTLARILAKALNCENLHHLEPCNTCKTCTEVQKGSSLDVIEIDGASNRGIDDIRKLNETVNYSPSNSKYKIYIIDEVHMLTKEAFNALLKTLEEPPQTVKFFFATTEPHKVLPTIISRCQRFDLKRISDQDIVQKMQAIVSHLGRDIETEALDQIASLSQGSLRDAESFLDQIFCFTEGKVTQDTVNITLALPPKEDFFELDQAIEDNNLSFAYTLTQKIYTNGYDFSHFIEQLISHFHSHLACKISSSKALKTTSFFTKEQLIYILDLLSDALQNLPKTFIKSIHIEILLLKILRSKNHISIENLIGRLIDLEQTFSFENRDLSKPVEQKPPLSQTTLSPHSILPVEKTEKILPKPPSLPQKSTPTAPLIPNEKIEKSLPENPLSEQPKPSEPPKLVNIPFTLKKNTPNLSKKPQYHYDTLIRFASIELQGILQQN